MMYSITQLASAVARAAHTGQTDKAGRPYFEHPARVAARAFGEGCDDEVMAAAYLHDVIEDTALTLKDLLYMGFPERTVQVVSLLTKIDGASYAENIQRAASDPDAALVKWCDVMDNLEPERLRLLDVDTRTRLEKKYTQALDTLAAARTEQQ